MSKVGEREGVTDEDGSEEGSAMEIETDTDFSNDEEETDKRPIKCPQCPPKHKGFKTRKALHNHTANVHSAKRFECSECGKKFARKAQLNIHISRVHKTDRPHQCDFDGCDKTYADENSLKQHKITHGEKLNVCPYCEQQFHQMCHLNRHIRISHPEHADLHETFRQSFSTSATVKEEKSEEKESQDVVMEEKTLPDGDIDVKATTRHFDKMPRQNQPPQTKNVVALMCRKHMLKSDSEVVKYWVRHCGLSVSEEELVSRQVSEDSVDFRCAVRKYYRYIPSSHWTASRQQDFYYFSGPHRNITSQKYKLNSQIAQLLKSFLSCQSEKMDLNSDWMKLKLKLSSRYYDPVIFSSFLQSNNVRVIFQDERTNPDFRKVNWPLNLALREKIPKSPTIYQMVWFLDDFFHLYIGLNPTGEGIIATVHNSLTDPTAAGEFIRQHPTLEYSADTILFCKSGPDVRITEGVCTLAVFLASQAGVKLLHSDGNSYPIRLLNREIMTPMFLLQEHVQLMELVTLTTLDVKIQIGCIVPNLNVKERVVFPGLIPGQFLECEGEESFDECLSDDE